MHELPFTEEWRNLWRAAALQAAAALDLFAAAAEPKTCAQLAAQLKVAPGRLRALLEVLVFQGALGRRGELFFAGLVPTSPRQSLPAEGPGLLAEVLRGDQPLADAGVLGAASPELRRFHGELYEASAAPAAELAGLLAPQLAGREAPSIADLGSGLGSYSEALLERLPAARAVLVDRPDVLKLAQRGPRLAHLPGDVFAEDLGSGHAAVLLCDLLHLCGERDCARLILRAAHALAPGGLLVVKDVFVEPDRSGPEDGLAFALQLALTTRRGDTHPAPLLDGWLRAAGLFRGPVQRLASAPSAAVIIGYRS